MTRIAGLICMLALAGCAGNVVPLAPPDIKTERLADRIPDSALRCAARPAGGKVKTQRNVAAFIVDLDEAGQDCRSKLNAARTLIQSEAR